ncbi:MAG: efflux RND transporter periplasmic adaptor subunit [Gammaproteobacteria bacterium]
MSGKIKFISTGSLIVAILVILVAWRITTNANAERAKHADAPISVVTAVTTVKAMPIQLLAVGQVQSEHTVNVQPQVSGVLKNVYFTEGQHVRVGQPLFQIDPAPFAAALASAKAAYASAQALANREKPLAAQGYVAQQDYEAAVATAAQAQSALQQAQINLSYTKIVSPIDGLSGNLAVKSGNVVTANSATPLVTINQMKPILVQYNLAQQFLPEIRKYIGGQGVKVLITNEDGSGNLGEGKLVFIDNAVNTATGTIMLKAEIPNQTITLWPGEYVGVNTQLAIQANAITIPDSAVQSGQDGNFVYVVAGNKVEAQHIVVSRVIGHTAIISSGLQGGDRVVAQVPRTLRPGMAVSINTEAPAAGSTVTVGIPQ